MILALRCFQRNENEPRMEKGMTLDEAKAVLRKFQRLYVLRQYGDDGQVFSENLEISRALDVVIDAEGKNMSEWQPIETAPSNVEVLLFCPDRGCESNRARIERGCASHGWTNEVANNMSYHSWATHWMPLPDFPDAPDRVTRRREWPARAVKDAALDASMERERQRQLAKPFEDRNFE
jgi:hypothetical protein